MSHLLYPHQHSPFNLLLFTRARLWSAVVVASKPASFGLYATFAITTLLHLYTTATTLSFCPHTALCSTTRYNRTYTEALERSRRHRPRLPLSSSLGHRHKSKGSSVDLFINVTAAPPSTTPPVHLTERHCRVQAQSTVYIKGVRPSKGFQAAIALFGS